MICKSSLSPLGQSKPGRLCIVALLSTVLLMGLGASVHHDLTLKTPGLHTQLRCADLTARDQDFGAAGLALVYDVCPAFSITAPCGKTLLIVPPEAEKNRPAQAGLPALLRAPPVLHG